MGGKREGEREQEGGGEQRDRVLTLFSGEALFGPLAHMRTHTNKQVTHTHTEAMFI